MTDTKLIGEIADALVVDHVELMRENKFLRDQIAIQAREWYEKLESERARRVRAEKWLNESAGGAALYAEAAAIRTLLRERDEARELAVDLSAYVSEYFMIKHGYKERVEAYATALVGGKDEQ